MRNKVPINRYYQLNNDLINDGWTLDPFGGYHEANPHLSAHKLLGGEFPVVTVDINFWEDSLFRAVFSRIRPELYAEPDLLLIGDSQMPDHLTSDWVLATMRENEGRLL